MVAKALILLVRLYQLTLSPLLGPVCRFEPTCSRYALQCLAQHGALRGSWLTLVRLLKCHPFHPGGYDPPPLPPGPRRSNASPLPMPGSTSTGDGASGSPAGPSPHRPPQCRSSSGHATHEAAARG